MSQQTILMMAEKSSINVTLYTLLWLQMLRYYRRNTEIDWESSRIQSSLLAQKNNKTNQPIVFSSESLY